MRAATSSSAEREFKFTDKDFQVIRSIVTTRTGITLSDAKRDMIYSRLSRRLRDLKLSSFSDYLALLEEKNSEDEFVSFTNAVTTNLTMFFRENHHFEFLAKKALLQLMESNRDTRRIRIWSSACSTGEEPYSIAMVVREVIPEKSGWDIKILATDLDTNVLVTASKGIYTKKRIENLSVARKKRFFQTGKGENEDKVQVKRSIHELITFKQLNLLDEWPMRGPMDIIFCRNVVIYFDLETKKTLMEKFSRIINPDGYLLMGHSESLYRVSNRFDLLGQTIYKLASS